MYGIAAPMMLEKSEWISFIKEHQVTAVERITYKRNLETATSRGKIEPPNPVEILVEMVSSMFGNRNDENEMKLIVHILASLMKLQPLIEQSAPFRPRATSNHAQESASQSYSQSQNASQGIRNQVPLQRQSTPPAPRATTTNNTPSSPPSSNAPPVVTLDSLIESNTPPSSLTVRQLKNLLLLERVSPSNSLEKADLIEKVENLLRNRQVELNIQKMADSPSETLTGASTSPVQNMDDLLCKICLVAPTNCVFLECGHLVCCLECGTSIFKTQKICCICRAPISRIVHTFRV